MKRILIALFFIVFSTSVFCREFKKTASPLKSSYVACVAPYDFGGCIEKIVINAGREILETDVCADDFDIKLCFSSSKEEGQGLYVVRAHKKAKEAYLSDSLGLPSVAKVSSYITLKLFCTPDDYLSPFDQIPIIDDGKFNKLKIENSKLNLSITDRTELVCPDASVFTCGTYDFEDGAEKIQMEYAQFVPQSQKKEKIPLIVFFHGISESGTDILKPLYSIKTTALTKKQIQSHFGSSGAAVLLPQCPTGWLEITDLDPFGNRLWVVADIKKPLRRASKAINDFLSKKLDLKTGNVSEKTPVSYYTLAVKSLIDDFIKQNPQIDTSRIYVGGCSAGGFMTLNMIIQYPDFFAAAFPVCEAFPDERISDDDIKKLAEKPIWFTVSLNDQTIKPEKNTLMTVERLKNAGAKNIHSKYFVSVQDTSGKFKNEQNEPWEYDGHSSWIYLFNDEISDGELNLFDWLSRQRNGN